MDLSQFLVITSLQNEKIKQAHALYDRTERDAQGIFLIEGYRELSHALSSEYQIDKLFFCTDFFLGCNESVLIEQMQRRCGFIYACTSSVFKKLSYRDRPDGLIAVAKQQKNGLDLLDSYIEKSATSLFVVAESIEKPGNLGTILRSADAAGVNGVIICDRCTDIYNPNVVRASVGTLFNQVIVDASSTAVMAWLKKHSICIVAATPSAEIEFTAANLTSAIAIAVGTEQYGLSQLWLDQANIRVRIPMHGIADSLNVATATTLLLYEAVRQRKAVGHIRW